MMSNFDYEIKGYVVEWFDGQSHSKSFDIAEEAVEFAQEKNSVNRFTSFRNAIWLAGRKYELRK